MGSPTARTVSTPPPVRLAASARPCRSLTKAPITHAAVARRHRGGAGETDEPVASSHEPRRVRRHGGRVAARRRALAGVPVVSRRSLRILRIVEAPTRWPSLSSSPWMRWWPQVGFSRAIRSISAAIVVVEGWATGAVRVGPLLGHQAAVPAQDRGRGDQAVTAQRRGQASDQCGEQGAVGPVQARPRVGSAEYGDLVAQDEQLDVLGRGCAAEQRQPAEKPVEDQVEQA